MIKKVSIQLNQNQSPTFGGLAIVEKDGELNHIYFDVVKSYPIKVIVAGVGKKLPVNDVDMYEKELLDLFLKHSVPQKLGIVDIPVLKK